MQKPEPLDADWSAVAAAVTSNGELRPDRLVSAMMLVARGCADEVRNRRIQPLTDAEKRVLDEEREDDPRFYELMIRSDQIASTAYVLTWFDKTMAMVESFVSADVPDGKALADGSIICWDHIVPEYHNHQLAHMAALIGSQLVSAFPELRNRTWLFSITDIERWLLFLGLAKQLDTLEPPRVRSLAESLASQ